MFFVSTASKVLYKLLSHWNSVLVFHCILINSGYGSVGAYVIVIALFFFFNFDSHNSVIFVLFFKEFLSNFLSYFKFSNIFFQF